MQPIGKEAMKSKSVTYSKNIKKLMDFIIIGNYSFIAYFTDSGWLG